MPRAFTVYYNEEFGEVSDLKLSEKFKNESNLMQTDIYRSVINYCEELREDHFHEFSSKLKK